MQLNLSHYSMGFLELFPPDRVELRGSGTLLKVGNTYGILTAAHVWRVVRELARVGIYLYPPRKTEMHSIWEEVALLDAVTFENRDEDEYGPDLAFIRIRRDKATSIELHGTFLNFERDKQREEAPAPEGIKVVDFVVGGVEAMGQKINTRYDRKLIVQESLANAGHTRSIDDGREGFDRLEFIPEPDAGFTAPHSYGGMSGGGCFLVYFSETPEKGIEPVNFHLLGVAFYETRLADRAEKIICHGRRSLTERLMPAVRAKWLHEN